MEGEDGKIYKEMKREYKKLCSKKKEEENERWMKRAREARTEGQVWEVVRRVKRKGGDGLGEGIEMGEWNGHFRELLERRVIMGTGEGLREDGEEWLGRVEIKKTLGKIGVIRCQN